MKTCFTERWLVSVLLFSGVYGFGLKQSHVMFLLTVTWLRVLLTVGLRVIPAVKSVAGRSASTL